MTTTFMSEDATDCSILEEIMAVHTLHLAPKHLGNISGGIKEHLTGLLLKYSEELKAIPIVFTKADSSLLESAPVLYDNPCVHVDVRVRWLALVPKPGARTFGAVSNQGPEYLGLLLLNHFNVTIRANQLKSKYRWCDQEQCWMNDEKKLELGDKVEFEILDCVNEGGMVVISGSIDRLFTEPTQTVIKSPKRKSKTTKAHSSWQVESLEPKKRKHGDENETETKNKESKEERPKKMKSKHDH